MYPHYLANMLDTCLSASVTKGDIVRYIARKNESEDGRKQKRNKKRTSYRHMLDPVKNVEGVLRQYTFELCVRTKQSCSHPNGWRGSLTS